ncbi:hypothetical protein QVD17_41469 [Tagetes erecta]|uniref:Uncharacterized protein n=1 Tax=Tagetes erecta TaxID=13708 RepID=A0AAD8JP65_TARER|nr:hypothetical protein QVD17_41469 [Tagetes erecta]
MVEAWTKRVKRANGMRVSSSWQRESPVDDEDVLRMESMAYFKACGRDRITTGVHLQLRVSLVNILQTKIGKRTHMQKTISAPKCSLGHENSPN